MVTCVQDSSKEGWGCDMEEVDILEEVVRGANGECGFTYRSEGSEGGPADLWGAASSRARAWGVRTWSTEGVHGLLLGPEVQAACPGLQAHECQSWDQNSDILIL